MGASGSWIMYNAMADTIMMASLMQRNNYVYTHATHVRTTTPVAVVHTAPGPSGFMIVLFILLAVVMIIGVCSLVASHD